MKRIATYVVAGLIGLAVVVGAGGGTAYLVLTRLAPTAGAAAGDAGDSTAGPAPAGNVLALEPFITNLADTDRPRYINITIELVARDGRSRAALEEHVPDIRDVLVGILNTKKSLEVTGTEGANKLKGDIMKAVNDRLRANHVQNVLITDFVVQF